MLAQNPSTRLLVQLHSALIHRNWCPVRGDIAKVAPKRSPLDCHESSRLASLHLRLHAESKTAGLAGWKAADPSEAGIREGPTYFAFHSDETQVAPMDLHVLSHIKHARHRGALPSLCDQEPGRGQLCQTMRHTQDERCCLLFASLNHMPFGSDPSVPLQLLHNTAEILRYRGWGPEAVNRYSDASLTITRWEYEQFRG